MSRVEAWERRAEVPLLLLAVAFLVAYAWPILDPGLDGSIESFLSILGWSVWAAFALDFAIRTVLADDRRRYVLQHWYDIALIALPMLRPLRLLRALAFARMLNRTAVRGLAGRVMTYVVGTALAACGLGSLAVLDAERRTRREHHHLRGCPLVGRHHRHHGRLRRPLPGDNERAIRRCRADGRRDRRRRIGDCRGGCVARGQRGSPDD